jgi:hypothetical protein
MFGEDRRGPFMPSSIAIPPERLVKQMNYSGILDDAGRLTIGIMGSLLAKSGCMCAQ